MELAFVILVLRELLHEVQLQVCNGEEYQCHAGESQVVPPQAPATRIDALVFQILISATQPVGKHTHTERLGQFVQYPPNP